MLHSRALIKRCTGMPRAVHDWDNVPGFNRKTEEYVRLDLDKWLADHGVLAEGKRRGAKNQPSAHAADMDGMESRIVAWINRRGRICRENVSGHLSDLERNLADMENSEELTILGQRVGQESRNADIALKSKVRDGRVDMMASEDDVRRGERDFKEFRIRSKLMRRPDFSKRKSALKFIFGFLFVEVILNATLLMDVNAFGLLGSATQMGLIGAINVLIAGVAMGGLLRQLFHVAMPRKVLSSLVMVPLILGVGVFNLLVAHFRDSMQAVLDNPAADVFMVGADTFQRFSTGFVSLDSFQSALLALLGFLFFCVASWKWLQRDDLYPGYGQLARRLDEAREAYRKCYHQAQQELRGVFNDYQSQLKDILHELKIKQTKWRDICTRGNRLVEEYAVNLKQYEDDLNFLLNDYRTANRDTRTEPEPAYFNRREKLDAGILDPLAFNPPAGNSLTGIADRVDSAISQLQDTFEQKMREYPTLEELRMDRPERRGGLD